MGHQSRLGHDRPYRAVGLIFWQVFLSVLGEELGYPPPRDLYPHLVAFQWDQSYLKQSPRTLDIIKYLRRGRNATSAGRFGKSLKRLSRHVKGENWIFSLRGTCDITSYLPKEMSHARNWNL